MYIESKSTIVRSAPINSNFTQLFLGCGASHRLVVIQRLELLGHFLLEKSQLILLLLLLPQIDCRTSLGHTCYRE